jgi:hypothetical protein
MPMRPLLQSSSNAPLGLSGRNRSYLKVVQLPAGSKLRFQPARLFASASPRLRRIVRILILREDLGVTAMLLLRLVIGRAKSMQAVVKPDFFSHYHTTQFGNQLFMKVP